MHIVFMGTPEFAVPTLERLILSPYQVVAVYTQPDRPLGRGRATAPSPVKQVALSHGLTVLQPLSLKQPEEVQRLAGWQPDVIVVAAFGQLLPQPVLDIPPLGCLNLHPSLLPRHRGPSPVAAAILAGDDVTGVTVMLMDRGLDTGPILAQTTVAISSQDTTASLAARLAQVGAGLLLETLPQWLEGRLRPQPQDEAGASYSRLITKEQGEIDWHLPAIDIWRRVRAFQPWPGAYTWYRGRLLKVIEAVPLPGAEGEPGRVMACTEGEVVAEVVTGEGVLGLVRLQIEGRRAMSAVEFLRGQRGFIGELLPS